MDAAGWVGLASDAGAGSAEPPAHHTGERVVPDCPGRHDFFFKTLGRHETGGKAEVPDAGTEAGRERCGLGDGCLPTHT